MPEITCHFWLPKNCTFLTKKILSEVPIPQSQNEKFQVFFDISENSHNFLLKLRSILQDKNVH